MDIADLLAFSAGHGASDLHLSAGVVPMLRVDGEMQRSGLPVLAPDQVRALVHSVMTQAQRSEFETGREADFSCEVAGLGWAGSGSMPLNNSVARGRCFAALLKPYRALSHLGWVRCSGGFATCLTVWSW